MPLAQVVCAIVRCSGIARKGTRCTITETSDMIDNSGRLVAQPLRRGGEYCALHAKPFVVRPATTVASLITVFLDLETTGVDVRDARLLALEEQMRAAGVKMSAPPRARSTKEVPCDGFAIPASLCLSAPPQVCRGVDAALWQIVW